MIKLFEDKKNAPDIIALVETKPKNSKNEWNPAWYKSNNYNIESVNLTPNDCGREILIFINKDISTALEKPEQVTRKDDMRHCY